jgi:hypothetical protein
MPMTAPEVEFLWKLQRDFPPDPVTLTLLRAHATSIRTSAGALTTNPPEMPLLATLPTGAVNARTYLVTGATRPLVILDEDMLFFGDLFAGALALEVAPRDQGGDAEEAYMWLSKGILTYLVAGHMTTPRPRELSGPVRTFAAQLFSSLQLFAVGHEFGHIMAGHLTDAPRRRTPLTNEADAFSWRHQQEHEADVIGARLATRAMLTDGATPVIAYAGTYLYFRLREILWRAVSVLSNGAPGDPAPSTLTHPSPDDRRTILHAMVPGVFDNMRTVLKVQESLFRWDAATDRLERPCTTALEQEHAKGVRPREQWLRAAREEI